MSFFFFFFSSRRRHTRFKCDWSSDVCSSDLAPGEAAVRAVVAGADCVLMPPVPDAAFEALQAAVKSGRIPKERLDASGRRILQAKARLGLNASRLVDVNSPNHKIGNGAVAEKAHDL